MKQPWQQGKQACVFLGEEESDENVVGGTASPQKHTEAVTLCQMVVVKILSVFSLRSHNQ